MVALIRLKDFTFTFQGAETPVLRRVNLEFGYRELALIAGPTGSGKSTLLKALNGLVPHFSGGNISGEIFIDGRNIAGKQPHELAHLVGYVNQQPEGSFVAATVREELAFGMEQLGFEPQEMEARLLKVAGWLGIEDLLDAETGNLSGGQQQRVAIGAAIVGGQQILLLDEPTSALDPEAAMELITLLRRLADRTGLTVILAEHRIERILGLVDTLTVVHGDGSFGFGRADSGFDNLLRDYRLVPPVVELGQLAGWKPLPLSVESARAQWQKNPLKVVPTSPRTVGAEILTVANLSVKYGSQTALEETSFALNRGEIVAVIGPNGSGKSSLLWAIQGLQSHTGQVLLHPDEGLAFAPRDLTPKELLRHLCLVPQNASDLLMLSTISLELSESDLFAEAASGTTAAIFAKLAGRIDPSRHPRDLSSGQQLALVLAIQLAKGAPLVLLDEPTRGLDYASKKRLAGQLRALRAAGKSVLIASHDLEFLALIADRCIQLDNGRVVASDSAIRVLGDQGQHSPQIWQVTGSAICIDEVAA